MSNFHVTSRMQMLNGLHKEWNDAAYELINDNEALKINAKIWKYAWICHIMAMISLTIAGVVWYVTIYTAVIAFIIFRTACEKGRLVKVYNEHHREMGGIDEKFTKQVLICRGDFPKIMDSREFKEMRRMHLISRIFQRTLQREGIISTYSQ